MLLLIGGLVIWKLKSSGETEVVENRPPPKPQATEPSPLEEPAPPPPTEEELAPAPTASAPEKKTEVGSSGPTGCSATCNGTLDMQGMSALRAKGGQARGCYNRALRNNATLEGKMTVNVKISSTGSVCSASISDDSLNDPAVSSCVTQMFRAGKFPAPNGGCVNTAVPLNFVNKQ
jgi:outer membrane biosynthesis protein TonB